MKQKLYLEITYGDNDWAEAINNVMTTIKSTFQEFRATLKWLEDVDEKKINILTDLLGKMIVAQLNLENFCRKGNDDYNYTEDAASIKFNIVTEDKIKSYDNWETVYIQLFGSPKDYGDWFIV